MVLIEVKSLSFASEKRLIKYLGLVSGAVSIFGLLNDVDHEVVVFMDEAVMRAERVGFHPNISVETLIISKNDFKLFLESMENEIRFIKFD